MVRCGKSRCACCMAQARLVGSSSRSRSRNRRTASRQHRSRQNLRSRFPGRNRSTDLRSRLRQHRLQRATTHESERRVCSPIAATVKRPHVGHSIPTSLSLTVVIYQVEGGWVCVSRSSMLRGCLQGTCHDYTQGHVALTAANWAGHTTEVAACLAIFGSSRVRTAERDVVSEVVVGQCALPRRTAFSKALAAVPGRVGDDAQGACARQSLGRRASISDAHVIMIASCDHPHTTDTSDHVKREQQTNTRINTTHILVVAAGPSSQEEAAVAVYQKEAACG